METGHPLAMFTEIYIEALLVDEEQADQVWEAWDRREIDGQLAWLAWWLIVETSALPLRSQWVDATPS